MAYRTIFDDLYPPQEEEQLFTPMGGQSSYDDSLLFSAPMSVNPEPTGTFATPTFDTDYSDDPFSALIKSQIADSEDLSKGYSDSLLDITDRQGKLVNSAENDWSTIGAALFGAAGAAFAGGSMSDITGGATTVGTTHYNNLEAQEKTKQALLEREATRVAADQRGEQSRASQLRAIEARNAAQQSMAEKKGQIVDTAAYDTAQEDKKELKEAGKDVSSKAGWLEAKNKEMALKVKQVAAIVPPGVKLDPERTVDQLSNQSLKDLPRAEQGYREMLEGLQQIQGVLAKGSQKTAEDEVIFRDGANRMRTGRLKAAEVGQAITNSEWAKNVAPWLIVDQSEMFGPDWEVRTFMDRMTSGVDNSVLAAQINKTLEEGRASALYSRGLLLPGFDYNRLAKTSLLNQSPELLNMTAEQRPSVQEEINQKYDSQDMMFKPKTETTGGMTEEQRRIEIEKIKAELRKK